MKLYILRPIENQTINNPWKPWYDKAFGFVIRASSEQEARQIADEEAGDENRSEEHPWLDVNYSMCIELIPDGKAQLILRDYAAA